MGQKEEKGGGEEEKEEFKAFLGDCAKQGGFSNWRCEHIFTRAVLGLEYRNTLR